MVPFVQKYYKQLVLVVAAVFMSSMALMTFSASATTHLMNPFTTAELSTWETDRQLPSGGVESVSFGERYNVAKIGVVAAAQHPTNSFYWFEGIKKVDNFGTAVQVDLYVPSEWQEAAVVNVGFWASDDPLTAYPLIVYRNNATVDAGFYVYNTETGAYISSGVDVNYDGWNTLSIALDTDNDAVNYAINGQSAGSSYAGSEIIGQVFLNHYNDGVRDYEAYWHAGLEEVPEQVNGMNISVDGENLGCYPYINTRNITVSWNADDAAAYYEYQADADKEAPYDFTTDVNGTERSGQIRDEDGTYNYRVRGVNVEGVAGEWSEWCGVTLDRLAPIVSIDDPEDGDVLTGNVVVVGDVIDENLSHYNIALYPGDADVNNFSTRLDQSTVYNDGKLDETLWTFNSADYADGEYQIRLAARDLAGNRDLTDPETGGTTSVHVISVVFSNYADSKDECKNGGWMLGIFTDQDREFRNQGDCVSHFASANQEENNPDGNAGQPTANARRR